MFIQTEATPNPATLKFMPGQAVMGSQPPADFPNAEAAKASPLASALFALEHVTGVFSVRISSPSPKTMPNGSISNRRF